MTPSEAEIVLDAMREEERSLRNRIHPLLSGGKPLEKDW
jgi:hypothetical protein